MSRILLAAIVGIPLVWHLALTAVTYYDAPRVGLEPRLKWTAITFLIPIFGFFIYLFERSELDYDPEEDPYRGNRVNIHPSRADDTFLASGGDQESDADEKRADREEVDNLEWGAERDRDRLEWDDDDEDDDRR